MSAAIVGNDVRTLRVNDFITKIKNLPYLSLIGFSFLWSWLNSVNGPWVLGNADATSGALLYTSIWESSLVVSLVILGIGRSRLQEPRKYRFLLLLAVVSAVLGSLFFSMGYGLGGGGGYSQMSF
jgi:hypothetical protein